MQNLIPFKDLLKQTFEKTFFIIHSGSREYLVPSSVLGNEKDKFYRLDDVSEAISSSIIYQKEEDNTIAYVDLNNVKAKLQDKGVTIDQVLADLESTLVGLLYKNLVDTVIAIGNSITGNEESSKQKDQTQTIEETTEQEIEQTLENETKEEKTETPTQQKNHKPYNNVKRTYYNNRKYYNNSNRGYKKSYNRNYKRSNKSDKS